MKTTLTLLTFLYVLLYWPFAYAEQPNVTVITPQAQPTLAPARNNGIPPYPHYRCHRDEYGAVTYEPIEKGYPPLVIFNCVNCQCEDDK